MTRSIMATARLSQEQAGINGRHGGDVPVELDALVRHARYQVLMTMGPSLRRRCW